MGLFVKICGCASKEDLDDILTLRPDAIGFVQWPKSPRYVAPEILGQWLQDVPDDVLKVGVYVDALRDEVLRSMEVGLDIAQLHGVETPDFCASLGVRTWKAVHLNRPLPVAHSTYDAEAFLLDYYGGARQPGGTGTAVDVQQARSFVAEQNVPVILAGGLRPDTVGAAVRKVRPWGVDVSSGVEMRPGVKDMNKVRTFLEVCRSVK